MNKEQREALVAKARSAHTREKEYVRSAKYFIKIGEYDDAIKQLIWATRAQAFGDGIQTGLDVVKKK